MEKKDRIDAFGAISLITFSTLLGLNQVLVKLVNAGLSPFFQAGIRSLFAFFPVLVFAWIAKRKMSLTDGSFWPGILCGILFSAEFMLLFTALDYTTVARASIFFYTMPFWVALGAHFLIPGERLTSLRTAGLVLAIMGIVLALSDNSQQAGSQAFIGDMMCLVGAMCWAALALIARQSKLNRSSPEMALLYQLAVSACVIIPLALWQGDVVRDFTMLHAAILTFQVLVIVAFGFSFWFWLLLRYPASDMASFGFLSPLFGVLFGWLILSEEITTAIIMALTLVAIGIYLVNRKPKPDYMA